MKLGTRNEHTIILMLLLGLAATLGFFDVAYASMQKKVAARKTAVVVPSLPETRAAEVAPAVPPREPAMLLFAGDVMLSRHIDTLIQRAKDPTYSWQFVKDQTSAADLFFVNLEAPFSEKGPYDDDNMIFAARPEYVAGLAAAGVDVVSFANNHYHDAGDAGVATTKRVLAEQGIAVVFPGEPAVLDRAGTTIGVVASAYNLGLDENVLREDIANVRGAGATFIVASMHAGVEYAPAPNRAQKQFAHAAIDAGANLVVGHHPHVTQTTEDYHNGLIVYSLGNFIFDQFFSPATMHGNALSVSIDSNSSSSYSLVDVTINRQGQPTLEK